MIDLHTAFSTLNAGELAAQTSLPNAVINISKAFPEMSPIIFSTRFLKQKLALMLENEVKGKNMDKKGCKP
jgi:hypothetical protein